MAKYGHHFNIPQKYIFTYIFINLHVSLVGIISVRVTGKTLKIEKKQALCEWICLNSNLN